MSIPENRRSNKNVDPTQKAVSPAERSGQRKKVVKKVLKKTTIKERAIKKVRRKPKISADIETFLRMLHGRHTFEIRVPNTYENNESYRRTCSGYFNDLKAATNAIRGENEVKPAAIYTTLNPVQPELLARSKNVMEFGPKQTTTDDEILRRRWLLIDIDPVRASGISSTNAEMNAAIAKAKRVREYLTAHRWPAPLIAMSGNGAYLLYRIDLDNSREVTSLIKSLLMAISSEFSDYKVTIDSSVSNASRLVKVIGTIARKGDELIGVDGVEDRPHRRSYYYPPSVPLTTVSLDLIQSVVATLSRESASPTSARELLTKSGGEPVEASPDASPETVERCRRYIKKMPAAIQGKQGSSAAFHVACVLFRFGLSHSQAMSLFDQYNERCIPPWSDHEIEHKLRDAHERISADGEHGVLARGKQRLRNASPGAVAQAFADALRDQSGHLTIREWRLAYWEYRQGRYIELDPKHLKNRVVKFLQERYRDTAKSVVEDVTINLPPLIEVDHHVEMPAFLGEQVRVPSHWKLRDLYIGPEKITHLPSLLKGRDDHSIENLPDFFSMTSNATALRENTAPPEKWLKFLNEVFKGDADSIELLRQWMGYLLTPDTSLQKAMLIVGPARSGKGTIGRIIAEILGQHNCCAPALSDFQSPFGLATLLSKAAAIIGDARLSGPTSSLVERFLSVTGEDNVSVNRKYRDALTVRLPTRITVMSNELPKFSDASGVIASRFLILQTKESFVGGENPRLIDELLKEKEEILWWAIQGWHALHKMGRFAEPEWLQDRISHLRHRVSPVASFIENVCTLSPDAMIAKDTLYQTYQKWCETNGITEFVKSADGFAADLVAVSPGVTSSRRRSEQRRVRVWKGITIATDDF